MAVRMRNYSHLPIAISQMNARSALRIAIVTTAMIYSCVSLAGGAGFAAHRMLNVKTYTFGPVGYGTGRTSEGESLYYTILKSPSALADFEYVWEHGNAQAHAYALTAFWKLDPVRFEKDATEFIRQNPIVVSQHVDVIGHIDPKCVVRGIRIGVPSYCYSARFPPPPRNF
jgi:hypothetical protein